MILTYLIIIGGFTALVIFLHRRQGQSGLYVPDDDVAPGQTGGAKTQLVQHRINCIDSPGGPERGSLDLSTASRSHFGGTPPRVVPKASGSKRERRRKVAAGRRTRCLNEQRAKRR